VKRTRVCLDCRTVVADLPECPGGPHHRIVNLATEGRAKLVDEVWGPPSWRRERRRLARAGSGGAAAGGIGEILSGCDGCSGLSAGGELGEILGALLIILAVALIAIVVVWAIYKLIAYIQAKRNEPRPNGALMLPVRHRSARRARGVVVADQPKGKNPITGEPCVGWAAELTTKRFLSTAVMLRDGASFGFDVRLEDGRVARVPAGLLRLHRGGDEQTSGDLEGYLSSVDPSHVATDEEPAIPYDRAAVIDVRPGDEVELAGDLHLAPDPDAPQTYRGVAAMVLVPNETIAIRRV
jgi:hypothetical protein